MDVGAVGHKANLQAWSQTSQAIPLHGVFASRGSTSSNRHPLWRASPQSQRMPGCFRHAQGVYRHGIAARQPRSSWAVHLCVVLQSGERQRDACHRGLEITS